MKSLSIFLVLTAATATAGARERIAVGLFKMLGPSLSDPDRQRQLKTSLIGGLEAADFDVVPQATVDAALAGTVGLTDCETTACLRRIAELVGVRRVVRATLEAQGANWALTLELIDTNDASCAARVEDTCQVCNVAEANEKLSNAAAALRAKLPALAPPITTTTSMRPPPVSLPPPPPVVERPRPWRAVGIVAITIGSVAVVTGIALMAANNTVVGKRFDASGREVLQKLATLGGGIASTVLGAVAIGGGVAALWRDRRLGRMTLAPSVAPGAAGLVLLGRF
jgi:hypothetical protein